MAREKNRHVKTRGFIKKTGNNAIRSYMSGPRECHTEWSQTQKEKYRMIPLYAESKKKSTDEPYLQEQKQTHTLGKNKLMVTWKSY